MNLSQVLKKWRIMSEKSLREVAAEIGIDHSALQRMETGQAVSGENLAKILTWLIAVPQKAAPKSEQLPLDSEQSELEAV